MESFVFTSPSSNSIPTLHTQDPFTLVPTGRPNQGFYFERRIFFVSLVIYTISLDCTWLTCVSVLRSCK